MKKTKAIGLLLMLLSFGFILRELLGFDLSALRIQEPFSAMALILLFSIASVFSVLLGAAAWRNILVAIHGAPASYVEIMKVYVKANAAKYLPGNVLHYAGRNLLGKRLGYDHGEILLSSFLEVLMILLSAIAFLLIFAASNFLEVSKQALQQAVENRIFLLLILLGMVAAALGLWLIRKKRPDFMDKIRMLFTLRFLKVLSMNFLLYALTFIIFGLILTFILIGIFKAPVSGLQGAVLIVSASVLSWFSGFITPGAPGGMGVREAVLILMLSPAYGREYTLAAALILRLISILGDVGAFGIGAFMEKGVKI